jgi:hypothetical protein
MESEIDYIKIFATCELCTGNMLGKSVLFRCSMYNDHLYFLLYDFEKLYTGMQAFEDISKLNSFLNPSLEIENGNTNNLILFILENVIRAEDSLTIIKQDGKVMFEIIINILKVRWEFNITVLEEVRFIYLE